MNFIQIILIAGVIYLIVTVIRFYFKIERLKRELKDDEGGAE